MDRGRDASEQLAAGCEPTPEGGPSRARHKGEGDPVRKAGHASPGPGATARLGQRKLLSPVQAQDCSRGEAGRYMSCDIVGNQLHVLN